MHDLSIDVTNVCNRDCIHCIKDKLEPRGHLPLDLYIEIIDQAKAIGITHVCFTGGEPSLHPNWDRIIVETVKRDMSFSLVINGHEFKRLTLPLLLNENVKKHLISVCFSLDGASATTHDYLRGEGSFSEVIEAASLCRLKRIPFSFKTVVTARNQNEIIKIALLAAALGATQQSFIALIPTPRALKLKLVPRFSQLSQIRAIIRGHLVGKMQTDILLEGSWGAKSILFTCNAFQRAYHVDHCGNLLFCCNLSHVYTGNQQATFGKELLADLRQQDLKVGLVRHYELLAAFMKARLDSAQNPTNLFHYPCLWCMNYFGKLEWTKAEQLHSLFCQLFDRTEI